MNQQALQKMAQKHGTPVYVYDLSWLRHRAKGLFDLCDSNSWLLRYAVKANPHPEIIKLFAELGLHFDASSEYEVEHLMKLGIAADLISLSSQQPPRDMCKSLQSGIKFVATSLQQLDLVTKAGWQGKIAVRLNPGAGAGGTNRINTGGVTAGFGIWHEYVPKILDWQKNSGCVIDRIQIHIGSNYDPKIWQNNIETALTLVKHFPSVEVLNMGGGFKVAHMPDESEANMPKILGAFKSSIDNFRSDTGRKLQIEIEPGRWLVAGSASLLSTIVDIVDTGKDGFNFIKLDTGMNDFMRPAMYGAQHPIELLNEAKTKKNYIVVGHNCESGDILTPAPGDPEAIAPRALNKAKIGDLVAIGVVGAYGATMRAVGYNSFPSAAEIFINE